MKGVTLDSIRGTATLVDGATGQVLHEPGTCKWDLQVEPSKPVMVDAAFIEPATWIIPIRLESESNGMKGNKSSMQSRIARTANAKKAVWRAMGPHWRIWGPVGDAIRAGRYATITVERMGGRELDTGNLWRSVKPVEDAIAVLLGCNDGSAAWKSSFQPGQVLGGPWGVRVTVGS